jgi:phosphopantetheinyl transferase
MPVIVSVGEVWERRALFAGSLTELEREVFERLSVDKRRKEWLAGRIAGKRAVQKQLGLPFFAIEIRVEESGRPLIFVAGAKHALHLSITHSSDVAAAIASRVPIGFDLERIEARDRSFEELVLTDRDRERLDGLTGPRRDEWLTLLWCEKEAYAKLAGEGLRIPFSELVVPEDVAVERGTVELGGVSYAFAVSSPLA